MTKAQLFAKWQELHSKYLNTEVEYDEDTATMLELLVTEERRAAVTAAFDQALNSGDGTYRP